MHIKSYAKLAIFTRAILPIVSSVPGLRHPVRPMWRASGARDWFEELWLQRTHPQSCASEDSGNQA
jgi:hypothetical protein